MLISRDIRVLHIEPTDVCQAACAQCARETDPEFDKNHHHHLTVKQILTHLTQEQIASLDKMFMCGNYGDPAAGRNTLEIYRCFRSINPEIVLGMNTNGAIQNTAWWEELGEIFHQHQDYVVFSIDGLEDTNHVYRRGVDWNRLMANAKAYIATGASAHWDMLVYQHNEHQVAQCENLARELGFRWFRTKVTKRPLTGGLAIPVQWASRPAQRSQIIRCHALEEQSLYIDAQGRRSPCCWLGNRQRDFAPDLEQVAVTWNSADPYPVCAANCGVNQQLTNFSAQWRREVQLC